MGAKGYSTPQEEFWAGDFGSGYIERNCGSSILASNLNSFCKALKYAGFIDSAIEFGANIGMNLKALQLLYPSISLKAVEINPVAAVELAKIIGKENVFQGSIFDYLCCEKVDLSFIKGVLIHINPDRLKIVYEKLYQASNRYILLAEYYSPKPVKISYRGHSDKLFKRDFAGEMLDIYPDLSLIDYGFIYHRDRCFADDDINWFLLEKK